MAIWLNKWKILTIVLRNKDLQQIGLFWDYRTNDIHVQLFGQYLQRLWHAICWSASSRNEILIVWFSSFPMNVTPQVWNWFFQFEQQNHMDSITRRRTLMKGNRQFAIQFQFNCSHWWNWQQHQLRNYTSAKKSPTEPSDLSQIFDELVMAPVTRNELFDCLTIAVILLFNNVDIMPPFARRVAVCSVIVIFASKQYLCIFRSNSFLPRQFASAFEAHINSPIKNELKQFFLSRRLAVFGCVWWIRLHQISGQVVRNVRSWLSRDFPVHTTNAHNWIFVFQFHCVDLLFGACWFFDASQLSHFLLASISHWLNGAAFVKWLNLMVTSEKDMAV